MSFPYPSASCSDSPIYRGSHLQDRFGPAAMWSSAITQLQLRTELTCLRGICESQRRLAGPRIYPLPSDVSSSLPLGPSMAFKFPASILVGGICLLLLARLASYYRSRLRGRPPPGPRGLPLVGNVRDIPAPHEYPWLKYRDWCLEYSECLFGYR